MKNVLDFLIDNWRLIATILVMVITLLIQFLKKKPVLNEFDTILLRVFEVVPFFITQAEATGENGETKKMLVMESIRKYLKDQFSINLSDQMIILIDGYVEQVLNTPQKKAR